MSKILYTPYEAPDGHSSLYHKRQRFEAIKQPVDLTTCDVVTPRIVEAEGLRGHGGGKPNLGSHGLRGQDDKVLFCVAAAALGCRKLMVDVLGNNINKWETRHEVSLNTIVAADRGVLSLKYEAQGGFWSPAHGKVLDPKLLLDWAALKIAVRARVSAKEKNIPELVNALDLSAQHNEELIVNARHEANRLTLKYLD